MALLFRTLRLIFVSHSRMLFFLGHGYGSVQSVLEAGGTLVEEVRPVDWGKCAVVADPDASDSRRLGGKIAPKPRYATIGASGPEPPVTNDSFRAT